MIPDPPWGRGLDPKCRSPSTRTRRCGGTPWPGDAAPPPAGRACTPASPAARPTARPPGRGVPLPCLRVFLQAAGLKHLLGPPFLLSPVQHTLHPLPAMLWDPQGPQDVLPPPLPAPPWRRPAWPREPLGWRTNVRRPHPHPHTGALCQDVGRDPGPLRPGWGRAALGTHSHGVKINLRPPGRPRAALWATPPAGSASLPGTGLPGPVTMSRGPNPGRPVFPWRSSGGAQDSLSQITGSGRAPRRNHLPKSKPLSRKKSGPFN